MSKELTHIPFDEFAAHLSDLFDRVVYEEQAVIVEREDGTCAIFMPLHSRKMRRRQKTEADYAAFRSSVGAWKELVDVEKLKEDIYASRNISSRPPVEL
ncbi:MAG: hypothetical protein EXR62_03700 [Chloroflexi bacterium]|nr:hypothetical protein [Chloroflexota bacterium]